MFTVIIPLYNKENYIEKSIISVLFQTFTKFELIIINDGSTDKSLQKIQHIQDTRLIICNKKNAGVSTARNNGVKKAKYPYITFLDADDWWDAHFLEEMKTLIEKYPDAGIYGSQYDQVKFGTLRKGNVGLPETFTGGYIDYFRAYAIRYFTPICSSAVVIKKKVFEQHHGFKPYLKFGEDFDLWVRIALKHKVVYINKSLAFVNHDVPPKNRALGEKLWNMDTHFIFQLDYLSDEEEKFPALKELLDGLRVRALLRYYLNGRYKATVTEILSKVDFAKQPKSLVRSYKMPFLLVKMYYGYKKGGYRVKCFLIQNCKRIK